IVWSFNPRGIDTPLHCGILLDTIRYTCRDQGLQKIRIRTQKPKTKLAYETGLIVVERHGRKSSLSKPFDRKSLNEGEEVPLKTMRTLKTLEAIEAVAIVLGSHPNPTSQSSTSNHTSRCRRCLPPERREGAATQTMKEEEEVAALWMVAAVGQREKGFRIAKLFALFSAHSRLGTMARKTMVKKKQGSGKKKQHDKSNRTRCSPSDVAKLLEKFSPEQMTVVRDMGFGALENLSILNT
ncbi:hypothetical protein PIB30_057855, partial [Stylosanthes scabra]|nr:hypothetical protein [Stylosanthes scabra]